MWRLACGGRSEPALSRGQWFLAMRVVALAQVEGSDSLKKAGPRLLANPGEWSERAGVSSCSRCLTTALRPDILPRFPDHEEAMALASGEAKGGEEGDEEEDLFL